MTVAIVGDQVVDLSGAADGDVLTVQPDGTVAPETPAAHHATHEAGGNDYVADPDEITTGESTYRRRFVTSSTVATGNQNLRLSYFTARKSGTYTQLRAYSGGTAAAVGVTLIKLAVFSVAGDGTLTCIGVTANDTSLFASPSTEYTAATTGSFALVAGQRYAVGVLVVTGVTAPTLAGQVLVGGPGTLPGRAPMLSGVVTGQADMPAVSGTVAAATGNGNAPYGEVVP